ncbi:transmembrane protein, putative (macronuclear) [Tetrahymena thermophila SB210]|uniref:Transmembrane protein, putative n=1 Tax=Tetrahymena thermophila (strain SB210) TaxID=312017 RepID=W7XAH2_TETTS|nr:transmembrane protein, putative [Tetrahymena thermophila SB210]EWS74332.1 transmembrane protein, putative [Tetrahymena thermophila SB210]|eukprot:XP_012653153.1 transmembrane protein, putative [Tetrahymena thermophila SB210]
MIRVNIVMHYQFKKTVNLVISICNFQYLNFVKKYEKVILIFLDNYLDKKQQFIYLLMLISKQNLINYQNNEYQTRVKSIDLLILYLFIYLFVLLIDCLLASLQLQIIMKKNTSVQIKNQQQYFPLPIHKFIRTKGFLQ